MRSSNPYLWSIIAVTAMSVSGLLAILFLRPDKDNTEMISILLGSTGPTITALLALAKVHENHQETTGRLEEIAAKQDMGLAVQSNSVTRN